MSIKFVLFRANFDERTLSTFRREHQNLLQFADSENFLEFDSPKKRGFFWGGSLTYVIQISNRSVDAFAELLDEELPSVVRVEHVEDLLEVVRVDDLIDRSLRRRTEDAARSAEEGQLGLGLGS